MHVQYVYAIELPFRVYPVYLEGGDDRRIRRFLARYLRLFYPNGVDRQRQPSARKWIRIGRAPQAVPGIIPAPDKFVVIEAFSPDETAIREFVRSYARW